MAINQPARPIIGQSNGSGGIVNEWDLKYYDDVWGAPGDSTSSNNAAGGNSGNGVQTTGITVYGSPDSRGAENAARSNASIYYGSSADLGADAQDYRNRVKGNLNQPSALAGRLTNTANQDISRANAKAGLKGVDTTAASIRERRNSISKANEVQQGQDQINLSNYGKSIGAGISGTESLAAAGAGRGVASTPTPTPSYGGGLFGSIICRELYNQKKITLKDLVRCNEYRATISEEVYVGYLFIATPIVAVMKKSDKFSNIFVGWARNLPNSAITKTLTPLCFLIGSLIGVKNARRA